MHIWWTHNLHNVAFLPLLPWIALQKCINLFTPRHRNGLCWKMRRGIINDMKQCLSHFLFSGVITVLGARIHFCATHISTCYMLLSGKCSADLCCKNTDKETLFDSKRQVWATFVTKSLGNEVCALNSGHSESNQSLDRWWFTASSHWSIFLSFSKHWAILHHPKL